MTDATWNSNEFEPTSNVYPDTHSETGKPIDISNNDIVALMGNANGKKAEDKYTEMKTVGFQVVASSHLSGNGDGRCANNKPDYAHEHSVLVSSENGYSHSLRE